MIGVFASQEKVNLAKEKYRVWASDGMPKCDENMRELLVLFNSVDSIATRYCCGGHIYPDKPELRSRVYIQMVVTEEGFNWLLRFYQRVVEICREVKFALHPEKQNVGILLEPEIKLSLTQQIDTIRGPISFITVATLEITKVAIVASDRILEIFKQAIKSES